MKEKYVLRISAKNWEACHEGPCTCGDVILDYKVVHAKSVVVLSFSGDHGVYTEVAVVKDCGIPSIIGDIPGDFTREELIKVAFRKEKKQ